MAVPFSSPSFAQKRSRDGDDDDAPSSAKRTKALSGAPVDAYSPSHAGASAQPDDAMMECDRDDDDEMMDGGGHSGNGGMDQQPDWTPAPVMAHQLSASSLASSGPQTPSDFPNQFAPADQQTFTDANGVTRVFQPQQQHQQQTLGLYPQTQGMIEVHDKKNGVGFGSEGYALSNLGWGWRKDVRS